MLVAPCPVHGGDNPLAFNITISGEYEGNWFCNTRQCHSEYIGVEGLLRGICENRGKPYYPSLLQKIMGSEVKRKEVETKLQPYTPLHSDILEHDMDLVIPSRYYIRRGFSENILREFGVGDFHTKWHPMNHRAIFPVYCYKKTYLGCVGRGIYDKQAKWKNSEGFTKSQTLYGIWKTLPQILATGTIILVEGQGDVLKLYESGVRNCAGMFSNFLCNDHISLLKYLKVHTVIILQDNDTAGDKGVELIKKRAGKFFKIIVPKYNAKDIGDLSVSEIKKNILPILNRNKI